jgi:uncharacterized protein (TIGR01777 family)
MKILITGATGLIGRYLTRSFKSNDDEVIIVTRSADSAKAVYPNSGNIVKWDNLRSLIDDDISAVINLAGMNLDEKRWNDKVKKLIYDSRINSTRKLVEFISTMRKKPEVLINASGVDYYGNTGDKDIYEDSPPGDFFASKIVCDWETEALKAGKYGVRVVLLRTGFVIAPDSKAFKKMVLPFRLFAGGYAGNGRQYLSWIHIEDLVRIYRYVIENKGVKGAVNASSPNPERMKDFAKHIGKVMHRPWFFPAPEFMMKILFGEVSDVILAGRRALPKKLSETGFKFKFEYAADAVKDSILF